MRDLRPMILIVTASAIAAVGTVAAADIVRATGTNATAATSSAAAPSAASPNTGAADVLAEAPSDRSVTVYRAPFRAGGSISLDALEGFALVTETRVLRLPAGRSRVRFEGVADGIEPVSAIVTGLPSGILEKNRDARLLSPMALITASVGKRLVLVRTDRKSGQTARIPGTLRAGSEGVVFETQQGIEALHCSGLSESFDFESRGDLTATPTLSVLVNTPQAITASVTLSYLARGFDWAADYTGRLSADAATLDLGAWVTLANGNGEGFPSARTQVVAGRLNRESDEIEPIDVGAPILAQCWPQGSTSDSPMLMEVDRAVPLGFDASTSRNRVYRANMAVPAAVLLQEISVTAARVQQEQLGDLKLYRVPGRTTLASRQSKQVRLLDRSHIPVDRFYRADISSYRAQGMPRAHLLLRTKNSKANHLGLALPSGHVVVYATQGATVLPVHESDIRDVAEGEEVEIDMGESPDISVRATTERTTIDPARAKILPLLPGIALRTPQVSEVARIEVTNATGSPMQIELRLSLEDGARVVRADHALDTRHGRPIFRLSIPAHGARTVRFQTQGARDEAIRQ